MVNIHYLSGKDGVPVITKGINDLDRKKQKEQKQNRWRGGNIHRDKDTPWIEIENLAKQVRARYILQTSVGSYYIKCFPSTTVPENQIPTSGELWDQMRHHWASDSYEDRKSRIWILDYYD